MTGKTAPKRSASSARTGLAQHLALRQAVVLLVAFVGCAKPPVWEFDELDVSRARLLNEVSLGKFQIPLPINRDRADEQSPRRNSVRLDFELHAVVAPEHLSRVTHNWERHEGMVRDRVIRVCRSASLTELQEPELSTLKARLMDAVQAHLGEHDVRRLVMTDPVVQEL
jgi:hypothetical protein